MDILGQNTKYRNTLKKYRLSGTDGLFKMGVNKVTKIKRKNKFMWSIKHQLTYHHYNRIEGILHQRR